MMKFAGLLVGLVGAMALFVLAQDNNDAGTQSKIIALEKAWNQAYKLGDRKALDTLLDDQIVLINDDGSVQTKRSEEHTSELQSRFDIVCRLLLEKKKMNSSLSDAGSK